MTEKQEEKEGTHSQSCGKCGGTGFAEYEDSFGNKQMGTCPCKNPDTKEFDLSDHRQQHELGEYCFPEVRLREFIKEGDKIFYAEDYGNDKVSSEIFNYATDKWEKFKKRAGKNLSGDL